MKRTPLKRTGRLASVSTKQRRRNARYADMRKTVWDRDEGTCQQCGGPGETVHHKAGRVGSNMTDLDLLVLLCDRCHRQAHDQPAWARRVGLMVRRVT